MIQLPQFVYQPLRVIIPRSAALIRRQLLLHLVCRCDHVREPFQKRLVLGEGENLAREKRQCPKIRVAQALSRQGFRIADFCAFKRRKPKSGSCEGTGF